VRPWELHRGSREEVGRVGQWRELAEARAHGGGDNGGRWTAVLTRKRGGDYL
jgi:hypothetical protein